MFATKYLNIYIRSTSVQFRSLIDLPLVQTNHSTTIVSNTILEYHTHTHTHIQYNT